MVKKIRAITCFAIILIIACATVAIVVVNETNVKAVQCLSMVDNAVDSISLKWQQVKGADGYNIYTYSSDTEKYEKIDDVKGGKNCSYDFSGIDSGSVYNVKICAYKVFNNTEYEGECSNEVIAYSLPKALQLDAYSPIYGTLDAEWEAQNNITGYQLRYSKNEDFKNAQWETITDNTFSVNNLNPNDVYYVTARAFIQVDEEYIYGDWSEVSQATIKEKVVMSGKIDANKPIVALSFDDGPAYSQDGTNSTEEILNVLEEYGARATFFMCGSRIDNTNSYLLEKEIKLGCELGNHTYDHKHYGSKVTIEDIRKGSDAIKNACGKYPTIFRCPGGIMTDRIRNECRKEGMPIAYWSVETEDWKLQDADKVYDAVMNNVYDGSIILMHDIYPSTAEAVKRIVPKLIDDGYQVVTVSEMVTIKNNGKEIEAGQQYIDYNTINNNT